MTSDSNRFNQDQSNHNQVDTDRFDPVQHKLRVDQLPLGYERDEIDTLTESLLSLALSAGEQAADHIMANRPASLTVATKSSATDMVTQMDQESERIIVEAILNARPNDTIIGEEETVEHLPRARAESSDLNPASPNSGVTWWIDPIDGTTNYVYNHPGFNISIAAGIGNCVLVGVVIDPYHHTAYTARFGHGAFRNDTQLFPTQAPSLDKLLLSTGFSYSGPRRRQQMLVMADVIAKVRDIRRMGAAAMDLCSVAAGRVDGYFELGLSVWDFAAGALIASEAGYHISSLGTSELHGASILVTHRENFAALNDMLVDAGALEIT